MIRPAAAVRSGPVPFGAPLRELEGKSNLSLGWYWVPHEYVSSDTYNYVPDRILSRLGTVNDFLLFGHAKGTLLLTGCKGEECLFPVTAADYD